MAKVFPALIVFKGKLTYQTRDFPGSFSIDLSTYGQSVNATGAETTRWNSRVSFVRNFDRHVTRVAIHKALKLIA